MDQWFLSKHLYKRRTTENMGSLPHIVEDCNGVLQLYSDGTIFRSKDIKFNIHVHDDGSVIWKDCQFDQKHNLYLRLYKPSFTSKHPQKLPILFFIHGGGFCVGSRTWPNCHNCCMRLSSGLQALVIAPDYRLAPEHRLPAAMEDAISSVMWLKRQAISENPDTWLSDAVDFDKVFIMGDSSGGNLAHHLAVHLGSGSPQLAPARVRGYVLMAPFFGGTERTKSEAEGPPETHLNLDILDRFWRLSIPSGETADHPLANPFGPFSPNLEEVMLDPIFVIVGGSEILRDRAGLYATKLKQLGKKVQFIEFKGKQHGFFLNDPYSEVSNQVLQELNKFLSQNSGHKLINSVIFTNMANTEMDSSSSTPELVEDLFGVLKLYSDGSIFRRTDIKHRNTVHDDGSSIWKDCLFDTVHNLHLRLYKPKNVSSDKLPILYYFHAGGFCFGKRFYPNAHNSCLSLCSGLQALVISPDYRLAPEHRLPAAIEDGCSALKWLQDQVLSPESCEKWLSDGVDLDKVFIFGDSSGGNMAHNLAVQLGLGSLELKPIRIRGFILLSPFFGGKIRTKSEEERPFEDFWSQEIYDQFWRMCKPEGADVDHPLVNPFGPESPSLERVISLDPFLVIVGGEEVMRDRVKDYAIRMKGFNHKVEYVEFKGKQHGFFTSFSYLEEAKNLIQLVQLFISQNS